MDGKMNPEMAAKLKRALTKHEGRRETPYVDSLGNLSWGLGYNITVRGPYTKSMHQQYQDDRDYLYHNVCAYKWFNDCNNDRKIVILDMAYNLGLKGFLKFTGLIACLEKHDYACASVHMLSSLWARQVK